MSPNIELNLSVKDIITYHIYFVIKLSNKKKLIVKKIFKQSNPINCMYTIYILKLSKWIVNSYINLNWYFCLYSTNAFDVFSKYI